MSLNRKTRWSQDRRAKGLCLSCSEPVQDGKSLCGQHLEAQRLRMKARYVAKPKTRKPFVLHASSLRPATESQGKMLGPFSRTFIEKIIVNPETKCWVWQGAKKTNPKAPQHQYGTFGMPLGNGRFRLMSAHKYAYICVHGAVPVGLELDHSCENKLCVNPEHLRAITHQENCALRKKSGPAPNPDSIRSRNGYYERRAQ